MRIITRGEWGARHEDGFRGSDPHPFRGRAVTTAAGFTAR